MWINSKWYSYHAYLYLKNINSSIKILFKNPNFCRKKCPTLTEEIVFYSYIGSFFKSNKIDSWNMAWYPVFLQWSWSHSCNQYTYNHCLYTVKNVLNVADGSFCCKITFIWLGSSLIIYIEMTLWHKFFIDSIEAKIIFYLSSYIEDNLL